LKVFLNGKELHFVQGGYSFVFMKPYKRHQHEVIKKDYGELTIELYDNGVQIRTLITKQEVSTLINREVAVDTKNKKIYILEDDSKIKQNPDGSVEVLSNSE